MGNLLSGKSKSRVPASGRDDSAESEHSTGHQTEKKQVNYFEYLFVLIFITLFSSNCLPKVLSPEILKRCL